MLRAKGYLRLHTASASRTMDFGNGLLASQCGPTCSTRSFVGSKGNGSKAWMIGKRAKEADHSDVAENSVAHAFKDPLGFAVSQGSCPFQAICEFA